MAIRKEVLNKYFEENLAAAQEYYETYKTGIDLNREYHTGRFMLLVERVSNIAGQLGKPQLEQKVITCHDCVEYLKRMGN
jgi:hypothetical protein